MFKKFLFLGVAFLATTAASTLGADSSKIRLLVPVQGTATGDAMTKTANPAGTTKKLLHQDIAFIMWLQQVGE